VHPTPPAADASQHVGHLILVQGQGAEHPVLLTALFDHAVHRRIWQPFSRTMWTRKLFLKILALPDGVTFGDADYKLETSTWSRWILSNYRMERALSLPSQACSR
jgi:hypothetical protein